MKFRKSRQRILKFFDSSKLLGVVLTILVTSQFAMLLVVMTSFRDDAFMVVSNWSSVLLCVIYLLMRSKKVGSSIGSLARRIRLNTEKRSDRLATRGYPPTAEKLLDLFSPPETAHEVTEHTNQGFEKRRVKYGLAYARRWYWWQVLRSVTEGAKYLIEMVLKVSGK